MYHSAEQQPYLLIFNNNRLFADADCQCRNDSDNKSRSDRENESEMRIYVIAPVFFKGNRIGVFIVACFGIAHRGLVIALIERRIRKPAVCCLTAAVELQYLVPARFCLIILALGRE